MPWAAGGALSPVELGHPHLLWGAGQRRAPPLCFGEQRSHLRNVRDREVPRGRRGEIGAFEGERMQREHVEVGRIGAGPPRFFAQAEHRREEPDGRHAPHARAFAVGRDARSHDEIARRDRLHRCVEGVEHLPVEKRREGMPAAAFGDPLGLEVVGEVGLVSRPGQPHRGQRPPGRLGSGKLPS